jgi:CubicO group peptidase (beta-lactamase class C family)
MKSRITLIIIGVLVVLALTALNLSPIGRIFMPAGSGIMAKQLCTTVFVSGLDAEFAKRTYLDPILGTASNLIVVDVDTDEREVRASYFGLFWTQSALYRTGLGCTLRQDGHQLDSDLEMPAVDSFRPLELDSRHRTGNFDTSALDAALDAAFEDTATHQRQTLGIAVLHQGHLVAERYAPPASRETAFIGWSMAKSVMATLAGVLVQDGDIRLDTVPTALESVPGMQNITLEHLLRMNAGLDLYEDTSGADRTSQMLFTEPDMAGFTSAQARLHAPGDNWSYMSGNSLIVSHTLQHALGENLEDQVRALNERLFEPLGIYSAVVETDVSGTFVGSSFMAATAHDWARLAQLYLDGGRVGDHQLIPEDWAQTVARPTPGSNGEYGMGFWLPEPDDGLPEGTFMMFGFQAQIAMIMPQQELVIVRLGASIGDHSGNDALGRDIARSLRPSTGD